MMPAEGGVLRIDEADGLGDAARLLVFALRRIAIRRGCPLIGPAFTEVCGEDANEVLANSYGLSPDQTLAWANGRRLAVGYPGGVVLTLDEQSILSLVLSAQDDDPGSFEDHLDHFECDNGRQALAIAARALATALSVHGLHLSGPARFAR